MKNILQKFKNLNGIDKGLLIITVIIFLLVCISIYLNISHISMLYSDSILFLFILGIIPPLQFGFCNSSQLSLLSRRPKNRPQ